MFKQLHINITLADALILMPKYQKMLKALLSNKEKLQELANTPLNENCSAVILKKLPEKLGDPGKFLIPCGYSELKWKALADLGASINLMPLSVWKKLGLPELIPTRMTLELANRAICTPAGIARDVFIPVGKFTFLTDFVIVDYESDPRVPLILGRPFLRTARALIDVHGEEMILRDGDERLTLNMRHDTSSYSNQPQKESINLINVFNNSKGCNVLSEKFLDLDSTKGPHPPHHNNPLSGNTTYFSNPLLKEFADELPPEYYDNLHLKDSIDQKGLANLADILIDSTPEMFTDEQVLDYSSPMIFDKYDDDFLETCGNPFHSYKNCPKEIASRNERVPKTYDYRSQYDAYEYDTYHANYNIEMEDDTMYRGEFGDQYFRLSSYETPSFFNQPQRPTQEYYCQGQKQGDNQHFSFDEKYDKLVSMIETNKEANRRYEASFVDHDASFTALETHVDRLLDQLNKDETYEPQGITVLDFNDEDGEQNEEFSLHSTNTMEYSTFVSCKNKEDVDDHNNSFEDIISPIKEHDKESVPFKV
nr:reverse transcriptase domain-containing protein [Tanacetum cinerariifolium]